MERLITFYFGKPCENDGSFRAKYFRLIYWFMVVFFTFGLVSAVVLCFLNVFLIPSTILGALVIPVLTRLVYSTNLKLQGLRREK